MYLVLGTKNSPRRVVWTVLLILLVSPVGSAEPDFPPEVKSALQVILQQRALAEQVVKSVTKAQPEGDSRLRAGYADQAEDYNLVISALKAGSPTVTTPFNNTAVPVEDKLREVVHFGVIWLNGADPQLSTTAPPEQAQVDAWLTIVQAIKSLSIGDRKKLLKKLDKDLRWVSWANIR